MTFGIVLIVLVSAWIGVKLWPMDDEVKRAILIAGGILIALLALYMFAGSVGLL